METLARTALTCAFWATATTAQYSGRGLAKSDAKQLDRFPVVILDTKERLHLHSPGVEETALQPSAGQTFNYRYRGMRLLIVGENRLFLVPQQWNASDTTLVVPLDESIRVQFQFQNDPPSHAPRRPLETFSEFSAKLDRGRAGVSRPKSGARPGRHQGEELCG